MPGVAATINGAAIQDRELAEFCIQRHGDEVLEGLINRQLIDQECQRRKITISEADLDAEIARAAAACVSGAFRTLFAICHQTGSYGRFRRGLMAFWDEFLYGAQ